VKQDGQQDRQKSDQHTAGPAGEWPASGGGKENSQRKIALNKGSY
jgi:hypothetical protein